MDNLPGPSSILNPKLFVSIPTSDAEVSNKFCGLSRHICTQVGTWIGHYAPYCMVDKAAHKTIDGDTFVVYPKTYLL